LVTSVRLNNSIFLTDLVKVPNLRVHKHLSNRSRVVPCVR